MKPAFLPVFILAILFSCKKDKKLPPEPTIELVNVSPMNVLQFKDSVEVTIKYKDNNGDLGDVSPDTYSVMVKDSRLTKPDWYHIPPLAPTDVELKIEGQIKIRLNTLFLLGNGSEEFSTLTIKLKDRAGNWSNEIATSAIAIHDTL
jgi:hypothetical protein